MKTVSMLRKTLGSDWQKLPSVIRNHYTFAPGGRTCVEGRMEIGYPGFLLPLIKTVHLFGGLVERRGADAEARVVKSCSADETDMDWHRTLRYPDGNRDRFVSRMTYIGPNRLVESIRFGFGLRLTVTVENGDLVYRSRGHLWQCGCFRLVIPDVLLLGSATIVEHALSTHEFALDFSIRHPLWGLSYYYRGIFHYCD